MNKTQKNMKKSTFVSNLLPVMAAHLGLVCHAALANCDTSCLSADEEYLMEYYTLNLGNWNCCQFCLEMMARIATYGDNMVILGQHLLIDDLVLTMALVQAYDMMSTPVNQ